MSDYAVERYGNNDHRHHSLSNSNTRESDFQYHTKWMAHWMKASSSSITQGHKHCPVFNASSKEEHTKETRCLSVEDTKSRKAKTLNNDMDSANPSAYRNLMRSNLSEVNLISDFHLSAEFADAERGKYKITNNSTVQNHVNYLDAKAVNRLQDYSLDRENFDAHNNVIEDNVSTESCHFRLFDINGKIESILCHTRKSRYGTVTDRSSEPQLPHGESTLSPHLIEFASEEHQFRARRIPQGADQRMQPYKSFKCLSACQDDLGGSDSHSGLNRFELIRRNMGPCLCSREHNVPSSSEHVSSEHLEDDTLTNLKHKPCKCSGHSTFRVSEMRDHQMLASSFKNSWSRMKGGSVQVLKDPSLGEFPLPLLAREQDDELPNVSGSKSLPSNKSYQVLTKVNDLGCVHHSLQETSGCSHHDVETLRIHPTSSSLNGTKDRYLKFSNTAADLFMTKNMSKDLPHEEQMVVDSADSAKVKETAFFEMLTLPTMSECHGKHFDESRPLVNLTIGTDTRFRETQKKMSVKTGTMYSDVQQTPGTSEGVTSSRLQKDLMHPKLSKCKSAATSANKQVVTRDRNTGLPHIAVAQFTSSDRAACIGDKELRTSRTESMDANHILSLPMMQNNSTSSTPVQRPVCSERSSRWEKRLRHNLSDSLSLDAKRFKISNVESNGEVCNLFSRVFNYHESGSDLSKCLKGKQIFDETTLLPNYGKQSSKVTVKQIHSWISRWCHSTPQTATHQTRKATPMLCEPENSKVVPETMEGKQFASIAGMALMGKTISNYRPCEFRRRGASVKQLHSSTESGQDAVTVHEQTYLILGDQKDSAFHQFQKPSFTINCSRTLRSAGICKYRICCVWAIEKFPAEIIHDM